MTKYKQSIINIAEICSRRNISEAIISPGSRSAPLTLAFLRHPMFTCRTIVDERSAAFVALGLAQQTERPVVLVCTSGTAGLNYAPALAEAYYQKVPLLVFTADRPPEWIDQNDGQTIHQQEMFGRYCRGYFELPVDVSHPDSRWHLERLISEGINRSVLPVAGPVQINVPLREPLYPGTNFEYEKQRKQIEAFSPKPVLEKETWNLILESWQSARKILIVAGMHPPDSKMAEYLTAIQDDKRVVLLCDITSNLDQVSKVSHYDIILGSEDQSFLKSLNPDLVISLGGPVVSKSVKLFLRKFKPEHWHIEADGACIDTFQSLTRIIPVPSAYFFEELLHKLKEGKNDSWKSNGDFCSSWLNLQSKSSKLLNEFLESAPHCELSAMQAVLTELPAHSRLQLGNSSIVRLASFVGMTKTKPVKINSNRGTSGIDGTLSTAVGAALATSTLTTAILGDLAFFYDRNGLFHEYLPSNLRIIIFNNRGGGIFRILDGSKDLPELDRHFEVAHNLTAQNTATDHGLDYYDCDSLNSLEKILPVFFQKSDKAAILEIHFDKKSNAKTFLEFKTLMREFR